MREFRRKGGGDGEYVSCESSWLCMKFEFAFIVCHGILIRVLPPSFLALPVNDFCLLFCRTLMQLPALCCTLFLWDFLMGFSRFFGAVVGFPYEIFCFWMHNFRTRFPSESSCFCYIICLWDFMLFGSCEIPLFCFMLLGPYEISWEFRMSFHALLPYWGFLMRFHGF